MKISEVLRQFPGTEVHCAVGVVDEVSLYACYNRRQIGVVLHRAYRNAAEHIDLKAEAPWVRFRQALNRGSE